MEKYDSIIFGNGFNCAVLNEMCSKCDQQYQYLFDLKTFLTKLYEHEEGTYEDEVIMLAEQILVESGNRRFIHLYESMSKYYDMEKPIDVVCNIETRLLMLVYNFLNSKTNNRVEILGTICTEIMGVEIKELQTKYGILYRDKISVKRIENIHENMKRMDWLLEEIFTLYNIHAVVLNWYVSNNLKLEKIREQYYNNFFNIHLREGAIIMTTNYGEEIQEYFPEAEHLHGKFVTYKEVLDESGKVKSKIKIKEDDHYRFFFGATPLKKHNVVEKGIYDDRFFTDLKTANCRQYGDLLIFGISFAEVHGDILDRAITNRKFYEHIDMHIIKAINDLFQEKKIRSVTVVAHDETDRERYHKLLNSFKYSQHTIVSQLYESGKIKIISNDVFQLQKFENAIIRKFFHLN